MSAEPGSTVIRSAVNSQDRRYAKPEAPPVIQSQDPVMQKTMMLGACLVVFALILIVGVIWFAGSKRNYVDRETALAHRIPTAELTTTATLPISPSPRVNWKRLFGYAALHSIRGLNFYEKSDYDHAISEYTEAIKLDPDNDFANASVYYYRGLAYHHKHEYDEAIRDFNEAIFLDPIDPTAYYYRGLAYHELAKEAQAEADFDKAKQLG